MIGMKPIGISVCSLLAVLGSAGLRAKAETEYFPPRAFVLANPPDGTNDVSGMLTAEFAGWFRRINEPSLWEKARGEGRVEAYRFLWLPGFDASYRPGVVRIEKARGGASLCVLQLGKAGVEDPGEVVLNKQVSLTQDQWARLSKHVDRSNFWGMPTRINDLGMDVETLLVEGAKDGNYHVVVRHSPPPGAYRELCREMLDLTGLDMGQRDWRAPPPSRTGTWVLAGFLGLGLAALLAYAVLRRINGPTALKPSLGPDEL